VVVDLIEGGAPRAKSLGFIVLHNGHVSMHFIRQELPLSHLALEIDSGGTDQIALIVCLLHRRGGLAANHCTL
jgi:hypothetical protein